MALSSIYWATTATNGKNEGCHLPESIYVSPYLIALVLRIWYIMLPLPPNHANWNDEAE